jgi:hypothetical protein
VGAGEQVSLLHLAEITEEGVRFQSPMDGSEMLLTPEMSMALQNQVRLSCCAAHGWHSGDVQRFFPSDRLGHHDGA